MGAAGQSTTPALTIRRGDSVISDRRSRTPAAAPRQPPDPHGLALLGEDGLGRAGDPNDSGRHDAPTLLFELR